MTYSFLLFCIYFFNLVSQMGIVYSQKDRGSTITKERCIKVNPMVTKFTFNDEAKSLFTKTYDRFEFGHIQNGNDFVTGTLVNYDTAHYRMFILPCLLII